MKKIFKSLALLILFVACTVTQKSTTSNVVVKKCADAETYSKTILARDLNKHLSVIASDEYEGRETGKEGQKKAAQYIKNHFTEIGLAPGNNGSYFQEFPLDIKDPANVFINVKGVDYSFIEDFYQFGGLPDTLLKGNQIVDMGYGINEDAHSDYAGKNVKGKLILIKAGKPEGKELKKEWNWRMKREEAQKQGAVAVFYYDDNYEANIKPIENYIKNPQMQLHNKGRRRTTATPFFVISPKFNNAIISSSTVDGNYEADYSLNLKTNTKQISSENVLGFLEGTEKKDEVLVITGHYDHIGYDNGEICNGADDDGSGTVSVLEIAEAFAKAAKEGKRPRRSILFMTVSGEEKGLLGSQYYVDNPVYPLENTIANLNIDMVGRVDDAHKNNPNYVYIIGSDKLSTELHEISEQSNKLYTNIALDYTYNSDNDPNRFYYRSDHYNFAKNGIPVIFYFNGTHEDYHKPTDDVEKINFEAMQARARLVFLTAWELANREQRVVVDKK
jgi:hypothetical protein